MQGRDREKFEEGVDAGSPMPAVLMPIIPGTMLGSYRIESEIGSGAFGCVYLAEHTLLKRWVALKALKPECGRDLAIVRRFLAEATVVREFDHPNIVAVTDLVIGEHHPIF